MTNTILFLGPNINKLIDYEGIPTLSELKNDLIHDIFKNSVKNPVLTTTIDQRNKIHVIQINSDRQLKSAIVHFNQTQQLLSIHVEEGDEPVTAFNATASEPVKTITPPAAAVTPPAKASTPPAKASTPPLPAVKGGKLNVGAPAFVPRGVIPTEQQTIILPTQTRIPEPTESKKIHIHMPKLASRFVKHVTCGKDSYPLPPNTTFIKTWRLRNDGGLKWPQLITVVYQDKFVGSKMSDVSSHPINFQDRVEIGAEVNISIPLTSPKKPGTYTGMWKLLDESGKKFGQDLEVSIHVEEMPSQEVLLKDDLDIKTKKKHLAMRFPNYARDNFIPLLNILYNVHNYQGAPLDDILNGTVRNEENNPFTMEEIINRVESNLRV